MVHRVSTSSCGVNVKMDPDVMISSSFLNWIIMTTYQVKKEEIPMMMTMMTMTMVVVDPPFDEVRRSLRISFPLKIRRQISDQYWKREAGDKILHAFSGMFLSAPTR